MTEEEGGRRFVVKETINGRWYVRHEALKWVQCGNSVSHETRAEAEAECNALSSPAGHDEQLKANVRLGLELDKLQQEREQSAATDTSSPAGDRT